MGRFDSFIEHARRMASAKGNGGASSNGAQSSSVTSLAFVRRRVAGAEAELEAAREAMRVAAAKAGIERAGLFSESLFVGRGTAERWTDEARAEGHEAGKRCAYEETTRAFCLINGHDFDAVMAQVKISGEAVRASSKRTQARLRAAGFYAAVEANDLELAGQILHELFPGGEQSDRRSSELSRQILTAAKRRDSDPSNERPNPEGLARASGELESFRAAFAFVCSLTKTAAPVTKYAPSWWVDYAQQWARAANVPGLIRGLLPSIIATGDAQFTFDDPSAHWLDPYRTSGRVVDPSAWRKILSGGDLLVPTKLNVIMHNSIGMQRTQSVW
jgi:hypothetical protein